MFVFGDVLKRKRRLRILLKIYTAPFNRETNKVKAGVLFSSDIYIRSILYRTTLVLYVTFVIKSYQIIVAFLLNYSLLKTQLSSALLCNSHFYFIHTLRTILRKSQKCNTDLIDLNNKIYEMILE